MECTRILLRKTCDLLPVKRNLGMYFEDVCVFKPNPARFSIRVMHKSKVWNFSYLENFQRIEIGRVYVSLYCNWIVGITIGVSHWVLKSKTVNTAQKWSQKVFWNLVLPYRWMTKANLSSTYMCCTYFQAWLGETLNHWWGESRIFSPQCSCLRWSIIKFVQLSN
jgi:hypothetical protein